MVEYDSKALDTIFHALGDATRRAMLAKLVGGERTVSELAEPFKMSLAAASKHIRVLESAGLIRRHIQGRTHRCSLSPMPLASADQWLAMYRRYWTDQLDALAALLDADDENERFLMPPTRKRMKEIDDECCTRRRRFRRSDRTRDIDAATRFARSDRAGLVISDRQ
jgi:DNA-binding transcriptional ArsR family regulator